nr:hypothetical protein [uncultured bacterium]
MYLLMLALASIHICSFVERSLFAACFFNSFKQVSINLQFKYFLFCHFIIIQTKLCCN